MLLPIVVGAVSTIIVYIFYKLEKSNTKWNRKAALFQTIGVVLASVFAVYSIQSANEGTNQTINEIKRLFNTSKNLSDQFEKLSFNLSTMPSKLEDFSGKLIKLDSIVDKQQTNISSNLQNFKNSISDFDRSLSVYRNSINDYSSQLSKIVTATDSQLVIWKEQQAIVKKEYSRRPILSIEPEKCTKNDSVFTIEGIILVNNGDIEANLKAILLNVKTKDVISVDNVITKKSSTERDMDIYIIDCKNLSPTSQVAQHDSNEFNQFKIVLKSTKNLKKLMAYQI